MSKIQKKILEMQKGEITEHYVYDKLSNLCNDDDNKKILNKISKDELHHYHIWESITKEKLEPNKFKIIWYVFLARIFGLSFALKLMEGGEEKAQKIYEEVGKRHPEALEIKKDEEKHERELIRVLKDSKLSYAGAIVLGLNDALVELTGTLAGLSFAFANTTVIAITGLIMGIAASFSMAASGYLSSREGMQDDGTNPIVAAIYTGVAYILTVFFLVGPYFIFKSIYYALISMLLATVLLIAGYTFYISIAKEVNFKRRFFEMTVISLGVALISFAIGYGVKIFFGLEI